MNISNTHSCSHSFAHNSIKPVHNRSLRKKQIYHLGLFHLKGLGVSSQNKLINYFGSAQAVIEADRSALQEVGVKSSLLHELDLFSKNPETSSVWPLIEKDLNWESAPDHYIITRSDEDYPALLGHIDLPPLLFLR
jgi:predicted Rossmann fold nucleotide-binding protein DprA/Smf involved in DNA uptake